PLAYVEWFTPFHSYDPWSDLFFVSPSTRNHRHHAEIISLEHIVCNCNLAPWPGTKINRAWTAHNI
ncbi:hypothetical protein JAAARDRAFT_86124, partial [Jaapia argillacea MUCL 33604]